MTRTVHLHTNLSWHGPCTLGTKRAPVAASRVRCLVSVDQACSVWYRAACLYAGLHRPVSGELCCGRGRNEHDSTWAQRLEVPHGKNQIELWTQCVSEHTHTLAFVRILLLLLYKRNKPLKGFAVIVLIYITIQIWAYLSPTQFIQSI